VKKETKENLVYLGGTGAVIACAATGACVIGIPIALGMAAYSLLPTKKKNSLES